MHTSKGRELSSIFKVHRLDLHGYLLIYQWLHKIIPRVVLLEKSVLISWAWPVYCNWCHHVISWDRVLPKSFILRCWSLIHLDLLDLLLSLSIHLLLLILVLHYHHLFRCELLLLVVVAYFLLLLVLLKQCLLLLVKILVGIDHRHLLDINRRNLLVLDWFQWGW